MLHWKQLANLTDDELATYDIAEVNLACAEGLPDAEKIDHFECIDRLNHYARCAADYTEKRMPEFYDKAAFYDNSEAKFRNTCMITLLQRQFGVLYHPNKRDKPTRLDTADIFIHGALIGEGGTCASLPVVYVAVGRRLGYPLRLVACQNHYFARWDEPRGERFNIEANDMGWDDKSDEDYRTKRFDIHPDTVERYCFLQSMTPRAELASFLYERGHLWRVTERYKEAVKSFLWTAALMPENEKYSEHGKVLMMMWHNNLLEMTPRGFPTFNISFPSERRFPDTLNLEMEHRFIRFESLEMCLLEPTHQRWWAALRQSEGVRLRNVPSTITLRGLV